MGEVIIVAPHGDDEIIGCHAILTHESNKENGIRPIILYTEEPTPERQEEILKLKEHVDIKAQLFLKSIPQQYFNPETLFYFPDPIYEIHPAHRVQGAIGENIGRSGLNVIFYTTNMNAPYIHETRLAKEKRELLETVYPSQKELWAFDHKYFLFEGYVKWLF